MKRKTLFFIIPLFLILFGTQSFSQIVKKNGVVYYKDHIFNPETVNAENLTSPKLSKSLPAKIAADTISLIKPDFLVNDFNGDYGADQSSVTTAIDGNGNYACAWLDYRNGRKQIFAQFFDKNDNRIGNNIIVVEGMLLGNNSPCIAANKKGDFVITWLQNFSSVFAQKFTKDGQVSGRLIQVNTNWAMNTMEPSVAVNNDGSFLIMWSSDNQYQVYARLFDKDSNPVTQEIIVSDAGLSISSMGQGKYIEVDSSGNYCVIWSAIENVSKHSNIYFQMINSQGVKVGTNTLISDSTNDNNKYFPRIAATDDGIFMVIWEEHSFELSSGVSARIFNSNKFIKNVIQITKLDYYSDVCNISSDRDSLFIISYTNESGSVYQKININGDFISNPEKIKFNTNYNTQYPLPDAQSNVVNNSFYLFRLIYNRNDPNIYIQKFNLDLKPIGDFEKIHDDYRSAWQTNSIVRFNNEGESIILWEDKRNGRQDLYAQVYDRNFIPVGGNIQIDTTSANYWFLYDKKVLCLSDGTFVIAFIGSEKYSYGSQVFIQLVNAKGEKVGENIPVSEKNYIGNFNCSISINSDDEILICWYDMYNAYIKSLNKSLTALSPENRFFYSSNGILHNPISISIDAEFNVLAVWKNYNSVDGKNSPEIFGQFFNKNGISTSPIFVVDKTQNQYISDLTVINDKRNFAVAYVDNYNVIIKREYFFDKEYTVSNNFPNSSSQSVFNLIKLENQKLLMTYSTPYDVYALYANDNKRNNKIFKLHTYNYLNPSYEEFNGANSADIFNDEIIFSYDANLIEGTGEDIWAKVWNIDNINFSEEVFLTQKSNDVLYMNYPNPFNSKTRITYEILAYHKVKLAIYNILGQEVKVLVDADQEKGIYEIDFDASGLSSGIYFCRLEAFNTSIKKMVLIK